MTWMCFTNSGRISWSKISPAQMYNEFRSLALDFFFFFLFLRDAGHGLIRIFVFDLLVKNNALLGRLFETWLSLSRERTGQNGQLVAQAQCLS